jgi:hypothetical protein
MQGSLGGPVGDTFGHSSKREEHSSSSGWEVSNAKRPRLEVEQNALSPKHNQLSGSWLDASGASTSLSSFDFELQSSCAAPAVSTWPWILSQTSETASLNTTFESNWSWLPLVQPISSEYQLGQPRINSFLTQPQKDGVYAISSNMEASLPQLGRLGLLAGSEDQNLDGAFWQNSMIPCNDIPANINSKNWINPQPDWGLSGSMATGMDWGPAISSFPVNRSASDTQLTYQTNLETQNTTCQTTVQEMSLPNLWSQPDTHMDPNLRLIDYSMDEDEIHGAVADGSTDGIEESRVCFGMVCSNLSYHLLNAQKLTSSDM